MTRDLSWTGPLEEDMDGDDQLAQPVPPERWPFGPPEAHEDCCRLHTGGLWCDCKASSSHPDDRDFGVGP